MTNPDIIVGIFLFQDSLASTITFGASGALGDLGASDTFCFRGLPCFGAGGGGGGGGGASLSTGAGGGGGGAGFSFFAWAMAAADKLTANTVTNNFFIITLVLY